jgi:hypothetical protein
LRNDLGIAVLMNKPFKNSLKQWYPIWLLAGVVCCDTSWDSRQAQCRTDVPVVKYRGIGSLQKWSLENLKSSKYQMKWLEGRGRRRRK